MTLHLYDSASAAKRPFVPRTPGQVGIYVCGLTTQASPHLGHLRSAVDFDILRRWLEVGHDYDVTLIRNVTDIDDKILAKSGEAGADWSSWSYRFERETSDALDTLGVKRPTNEPRASGHIPEIIEFIRELIVRGHAYPTKLGDVYFSVPSFAHYGSLTHQSEGTQDTEPSLDKHDPRDFALWKSTKLGEPEVSASWQAPWGWGRPGWHIECSAMARRFLGASFDIHGGGRDLRFPHHENEYAQSRASGDGFAQTWMHTGLLMQDGRKVSKSLGTELTLDNLMPRYTPLAIRYFLAAAHYRSDLEFSYSGLDQAAASVERLEAFMRRHLREAPPWNRDDLPPEFVAAMDDDLAISRALAVIFTTMRDDTPAAARSVSAMLSALGMNPLEAPWAGHRNDESPAGSSVIDRLVAARQEARAQRDFARSDLLRDVLADAGVTIADTPDGPHWTVR